MIQNEFVTDFSIQSRVLVLLFGGTINADRRKTRPLTLESGEPATMVEVYKDARGRMPAQIYIEDVLKAQNVDMHEIAAKDSKRLDQADYDAGLRMCRKANEDGYVKILICLGTDRAVEYGRFIERENLPLTVILVTAMDEMTRDMDLAGNVFVSRTTDGLENIDRALAVQLPHGVYIETRNKGFVQPSQARKNFEGRYFEAIDV